MHTTVTVEGAARLFLHQFWKLHGLLKYVISDHGPQFIACFTKELYCLLGIKLASSTAVRATGAPDSRRIVKYRAEQDRVGRNGAELLWSGRELTTKVGNNLGLSSCAVPRSTVMCVVAYFRRTELLSGVPERSGID